MQTPREEGRFCWLPGGGLSRASASLRAGSPLRSDFVASLLATTAEGRGILPRRRQDLQLRPCAPRNDSGREGDCFPSLAMTWSEKSLSLGRRDLRLRRLAPRNDCGRGVSAQQGFGVGVNDDAARFEQPLLLPDELLGNRQSVHLLRELRRELRRAKEAAVLHGVE